MSNHEEQIAFPFAPSSMVSEEMQAGLSVYGRVPEVEMPDDVEVIPATDKLEWDEETNRMRITTKVPTDLCKWLTGDWSCEKEDPNFKPVAEAAANACSPAALERLEDDVEKAEDKCLRRVKVPRNRLVPIIHELAKIYPQCSIALSGFFLYPKDGGYMGWHTNSDSPCARIYVTHVAEGGKSFFRYRDNGEYVTSWDKEGWNLRQFEVTTDNPLWHCVYSEVPRLSIGFRLNKNLL